MQLTFLSFKYETIVVYDKIKLSENERRDNMKLIFAIDDNYHILFNHRRVSRDGNIIKDIQEALMGRKLYVNNFSASLFDGFKNLIVDNDFLNVAESNTFCFVENVDVAEHIDKVEMIVIYRFNRIYPGDFSLDKTILNSFSLDYKEDFAGTSHDKITREVYFRKDV